ncbi:uncharacterized protein LOC103579528 isoform X3 [Microplitis demolitor]|uniref:uncharacterized protein LOC103579528 isoform X3 n=1 Tax=Microplitis demolitor TaxID=69319 RepID=UPI0004CCF13F|nr:uncharacterized protein LOC103579528 isoform X3 [Microplitis demolitor]
MLVPPVAQGGTGSRQVGDPGVRSAHNSVPGTATALWPLAPAHTNLPGNHQSQATPPLAATPGPPHNQGINRYELYSLFPGSNGGSYVATTPATPSATPGRTYHATTHKVSESVFSAAVGVGVGGYTWGAPTPPPGSPYSPVPGVTQLELLAKNLASLAPHHPQQPLTLQGVGVNVGASVHHAQHTQHTLNLAGLHHLHHGESMVTSTSTTSFTSKFIDERILTLGGLHQGTFSPQLSLVTAGTPTLTINSFSSPNTQASVVPTNGGLLVQEYQPGEPNNQIAVCPSSTSGSSSIPTATAACTVSTVIVQGAQTGSTFVQSTMKKRESFVTAQAAAQTSIKLENKTTRQSCICKSTNVNSSGKTKVVHSEAGCSRTLPVVSSWNGQDTSSCANTFNQSAATNLIKREPLAAVPCQVAEVSTSLHATTTAVKIEPLPPKSENGIVVSTAAASGIPVGIAVARQRLQHHQETSSTSMRNVSLSHHTSHHASYHHFQPDNLGSTTAMAMGGATLVHCGTGGEDRPAHLAIPSGAALAPSLSATLNSGLSNIGPSAPGTWPPTLWQYPTTAAMPSLEPVGFPQLGVGLQGGLQLVRDPTTGHLLLIHAAAEQMQQAVVWPNYPSVHSAPNIGAPPLLLPGPTTPPSLQLLSDINGARLVLTENKRKQQNNVPIVKIEADCATPNTTIIASAESSKALQTVTTMTGSLVTDTPLLTTLHYYPHAPALVQISQSESMQCRTQQRNTFISKATSPVSCLTPPPEVMPAHAIETLDNVLNVQDASNQTDAPDTEDDHPSIEIDGLPIKQEQVFSSCHQTPGNFTIFDVVSSSIERPQLNSVNDSASNVHKKPAKADKASIAPLSNDLLKTEAISSIDQAIDSVVCKSTEEDDEVFDSAADEAVIEERIRRRPSRVIEITEENCDSFHENLEFFGRRKDPVELHRKPQYSEEMFNKEKLRCEELSINENVDVTDDANADKDYQQPVSSTLVISEQTEDIEDVNKNVKIPSSSSIELLQSSDQVDSSCSPCEKIIDDPPISGKSLDMPSIDCDDEVNQHVNVKVKQESVKSNNYDECPVVDNKQSLPDKLNRDKKNNNDKFHAGIENVVEKLKKNAAAAQQDSSLTFKSNDKEQIDDNFNSLVATTTAATPTTTTATPVVRSVGRCLPRTLNNGLKKHILRFYETESLISENVNSNSIKNDDIDDKNNDIFKEDALLSNNNNDKLSQVVNPTVISEKIKNLSSKLDTDGESSDDDLSCKLNIKSSADRLKNLQTLQQYKNNQTGKIKSNVDLSGLELLSNSIAQLEHLKPDAIDNTSSSDIENSPVKQKVKGSQENNNNVDSPLGLLCALAEQRFMEEVGDDVPKGVNSDNADISHAGVLLINLGKVTGSNDNNNDKDKDNDKDNDSKLKCEKRRHSVDDTYAINLKKTRKDLFYSFENNDDANDDLIKNKYSDNYEEADDADDDCTDSDNDETKTLGNNDKDDGNLSPVEFSMRERLADIKKKYKEKQNELTLPLDQDLKSSLDNFDGKLKQYDDIPSHSDSISSSRFNKNLTKLAEPRSHIKLLDSIPSISIPVPVPESSPVNKIVSEPEDDDNKNPAVDYDTSSSSPTVRSSSSAKKRKVGRPKKLMCTSTSARHLTETIVAKKSRSKSSLVSCLINSKNRHSNKLNGKTTCGLNSKNKINQTKMKPIKQTPLHNKNVICSIIAEKAKLSQDAKLEKQIIKLKPKFKNHGKVKDWNDDKIEWDYSGEKISSEIDTVVDKPELEINDQVADKFPHVYTEEQSIIKDNDIDDDNDKKDEFEHHEKSKKKKRKSSSSSPMRRKSSEHDKKESKRRKSSDCKECKECAKAAKAEKVESIANKCKLVSAHLEIDQLRVLTAMGGLFYAGRLSAVQAPDIYAITLDGERGNRPHIHSREEILRDAIVEICPTSTKELLPGTRLCAYWSQQYRCLYPGTSVESSEPDSDLDDKFVSVEFDDGDSGRIALDDIRLLLPDYPVVEYDPNPLLTLGKKRRLTSMSDDKRSDQSVSAVTSSLVDNDKMESENNTKEFDEKSANEYRERKKLKKRRRDKLKRLEQLQDGKKRHKRHKCCEEHRKHKHRKHRKHKHKHAHHSSHNESSHFSGGESCSGLRTDEEEDEEDKDKNVDGGRDENEDATNGVIGGGKDFINEESEVENEIVQVQDVVDEEPAVEEKNDKTKKSDKKTKARERQESVESRSKMAAFLPARQLWGWAGKGYRRPGAKGRAKKQFFKAIQRGTETIQIGDSAVFLSTGRPDRPYIGKIESMWETTSSNMIVKVKWFYHPEETVGCPANLKYPGALFESPHMDENDVQTISHKCEVLPLQDYTTKLGKEPHRYLTIYDNNDIYYLAGYYDPTTYLLTLQPGVA